MDRAETGHHCGDGHLHGFLVTDVGLHEHRALGPSISHGLFARFDVQIENSDTGAFFLDQVERGGQAETEAPPVITMTLS